MYAPLIRTTFDNGYTLSVVTAPYGALEVAIITPNNYVREPKRVSSWTEVYEIKEEAKKL